MKLLLTILIACTNLCIDLRKVNNKKYARNLIDNFFLVCTYVGTSVKNVSVYTFKWLRQVLHFIHNSEVLYRDVKNNIHNIF
jgi:hypothetical protein